MADSNITKLRGRKPAIPASATLESISNAIHDEYCALRCAFAVIDDADSSGIYDKLSYGANLMERSLCRLDELTAALDSCEMKVRAAEVANG